MHVVPPACLGFRNGLQRPDARVRRARCSLLDVPLRPLKHTRFRTVTRNLAPDAAHRLPNESLVCMVKTAGRPD
jgi:hypothetical protein